jgi:hypothetical protein
MSNVKIPAFAEAASRRQANDKGMSKCKSEALCNLNFGFDLTFELWHLKFNPSDSNWIRSVEEKQ